MLYWCSLAKDCDRQWKHIAEQCELETCPDATFLLVVKDDVAFRDVETVPLTDVELDNMEFGEARGRGGGRGGRGGRGRRDVLVPELATAIVPSEPVAEAAATADVVDKDSSSSGSSSSTDKESSNSTSSSSSS